MSRRILEQVKAEMSQLGIFSHREGAFSWRIGAGFRLVIVGELLRRGG